MNERGDISPALQHWFADGPTTMPDRVVNVVADRIAREPQRRGWRLRWGRQPKVNAGLAVAVVVGLLVVALVAAALIGGSSPFDPPRIRPVVQPVASATPTPSLAPSATSPAAVGPGLILIEVANLKMPNELRYIAPDKRALPFLPDFGGHQRAAAWRPDGQRVAFAGRPDGHPDQWMDLYETLPDGTSLTLLSTDCEPPACVDESDPAYSPDGSKIVAVRQADLRDGTPTRVVLVIVDLATGESTEIPGDQLPIRHLRHRPPALVARWHADRVPRRRRPADRATPADIPGTDIAWSELDLRGRDRWFRPASIDTRRSACRRPDWSPDGSTHRLRTDAAPPLALRPGPVRLEHQSIRPDGTDLHVIVPGPDVATPSWTAGGAQILFPNHGGHRAVDPDSPPDGSDIRDIASFPSPARSRCTRSSSPRPERLRRIPTRRITTAIAPTLVRRANERRSTCSNFAVLADR